MTKDDVLHEIISELHEEGHTDPYVLQGSMVRKLVQRLELQDIIQIIERIPHRAETKSESESLLFFGCVHAVRELASRMYRSMTGYESGEPKQAADRALRLLTTSTPLLKALTAPAYDPTFVFEAALSEQALRAIEEATEEGLGDEYDAWLSDQCATVTQRDRTAMQVHYVKAMCSALGVKPHAVAAWELDFTEGVRA